MIPSPETSSGPPGSGFTGPVGLSGRTAPSKVLFGPHETNLAEGRAISGAHAAGHFDE